MYKIKFLITIGLISLFSFACQQKLDKKKLEQELLDLHQETLDAHLNKNVEFFVRDISEDYFQVHDGEFLHPTKEEIHSMFTHYLNSTEFERYDDLREPMVKVSDDGSLGWTIVQVRLVGEQQLENDSVNKMDYTYAWITLYEREDGKWIRLGEVDNYKEGE
ncbi:MAG: nuclear transport factor 2 family protein [Bacteroidetes bacterium]|nr:nuclear transport factor 2 family protein [Bacteroidota bacterium]